MKEFFLIVISIITVLSVSSVSYAQDVNEPQSNVEVVAGEPTEERGEMPVGVLSVILLVVIMLAVPAVLSFMIMYRYKNGKLAYGVTYFTLAGLYFIYSLIDGKSPNDAASITIIYLLLPSIFGSLIGQAAYYFIVLKEPKKPD